MGVLAVLIVKLFDPISVIIGVIGGFSSKSYASLLIWAFAGATIGEILLFLTQETRIFSLTPFLIAVIAIFLWAWAVYMYQQYRRRSTEPPLEAQASPKDEGQNERRGE